MDPLLTSEHPAGGGALAILDEAAVAVARQRVRERGTEAGLPTAAIERMAIIASELGHNHLAHARRGFIDVRPIARDGIPGLELSAADSGPGLADPAGALRGGASTTGTLGVGLAGVRRMAAELDIDVRLGEGTCMHARVFAAPVRRRREVGIFGRPHEHERRSGDGAAFLRPDDHTLFLAMVDGLGHGEPALEASLRALSTLRATIGRPPQEQLAACDRALRPTRGAVVGLLRLDERDGSSEGVCAGNVGGLITAHQRERRLGCTAATLGAGPAGRVLRIPSEYGTIGPREVIVLFTDGLSSRTSLEGQGELLLAHPVTIAQHLLAAFGRTNDDALVLVAR